MFGGGGGGGCGGNSSDDDDMLGGSGGSDDFNEDDFGDEDDEKFSSVNTERGEDPSALYYCAKECLDRPNGKEEALELLELAAQAISAGERDADVEVKVHKRLFRVLVDLGHADKASAELQRALECFRSALASKSQAAEKAVLKVVDAAIGSALGPTFARSVYEALEQNLEELNFPHLQGLVFRTNQKYAQYLIELIEKNTVFPNVSQDVLAEALSGAVSRMHRCCTNASGEDDVQAKAPQLAEVYSLELRLCVCRRGSSSFPLLQQLRILSAKALSVCTGTSPPRISGVIKECAGMAALADGLWGRARECFFDAFVSFNEAGSPRRLVCLRRLVLSAVLDFSAISPFDSPEARGFAKAEELEGARHLWKAYTEKDLSTFEALLESEPSLVEDEAYAGCREHLVHVMRLHVLADTLRPYRRVRIGFLCDKMSVSRLECERLLAELIVDEVVSARINEPEGIVTMLEPPTEEALKQKALCDWAAQTITFSHTLFLRFLGDK